MAKGPLNVRFWPKPDTIWSNQDARMVKKLIPPCGLSVGTPTSLNQYSPMVLPVRTGEGFHWIRYRASS